VARYQVEVEYKMKRKVGVYASSEEEAKEKACAVVDKWEGVIETEAGEAEEE